MDWNELALNFYFIYCNTPAGEKVDCNLIVTSYLYAADNKLN